MWHAGAPPNVELETFTEADTKQTAVSCLDYKDKALGRAESLLVPRSTPLPVQPFARVALADLPQPLGRAGHGLSDDPRVGYGAANLLLLAFGWPSLLLGLFGVAAWQRAKLGALRSSRQP